MQASNWYHVVKLVYSIYKQVIAQLCVRKCSRFKSRNVKMFLLKLGLELQNVVKKFQSAMKIYTKYTKGKISTKWNAQRDQKIIFSENITNELNVNNVTYYYWKLFKYILSLKNLYFSWTLDIMDVIVIHRAES